MTFRTLSARRPRKLEAGGVRHHLGIRVTSPTRTVLEIAPSLRFGLPTPRLNTHVAGYEVDALFEHERVIVELDGYQFHDDKASFEDDRERDAATLAAGHATVRVTWERLHDQAHREAARLQQILRARRKGGAEAA